MKKRGHLYQQRSDAEANGPCKAVGDIVANRLLKGCQVHWAKSYQRVPDKVYRTAEEKMAYNRIASCIRTKANVLLHFQVLCGEKSVEALYLSGIQPFQNIHWEKARSWVEWWTRRCHLQMLCKEFSPLDDMDWSQ